MGSKLRVRRDLEGKSSILGGKELVQLLGSVEQSRVGDVLQEHNLRALMVDTDSSEERVLRDDELPLLWKSVRALAIKRQHREGEHSPSGLGVASESVQAEVVEPDASPPYNPPAEVPLSRWNELVLHFHGPDYVMPPVTDASGRDDIFRRADRVRDRDPRQANALESRVREGWREGNAVYNRVAITNLAQVDGAFEALESIPSETRIYTNTWGADDVDPRNLLVFELCRGLSIAFRSSKNPNVRLALAEGFGNINVGLTGQNEGVSRCVGQSLAGLGAGYASPKRDADCALMDGIRTVARSTGTKRPIRVVGEMRDAGYPRTYGRENPAKALKDLSNHGCSDFHAAYALSEMISQVPLKREEVQDHNPVEAIGFDDVTKICLSVLGAKTSREQVAGYILAGALHQIAVKSPDEKVQCRAVQTLEELYRRGKPAISETAKRSLWSLSTAREGDYWYGDSNVSETAINLAGRIYNKIEPRQQPESKPLQKPQSLQEPPGQQVPKGRRRRWWDFLRISR